MTAATTTGLAVEQTGEPVTHARGPAAPPPLAIAFFGYDRTDTTIMKRTLALRAAGASIVGFMFRRLRGMEAPELPFPVVDLGTTVDRSYLRRLPALAGGLVRIVRNRHLLRGCRVIYARNLDMLALAVAARSLTGTRAAIVYEFLDAQPVLLGSGAVSRAFRRAERLLLSSTVLTVVSSPAYIGRYFEARQNHRGPFCVLENKLDAARVQGLRAQMTAPQPGEPWVIGWFGVLRCRRSLAILTRIAERLGSRVRIEMRGIPSETDVPRAVLERTCREHANMVYDGPYVSPRDLPSIYGSVHLVWATDFADPSGNSAWCLTNRLYEGGYFDIPALGLRGTATGDMIERSGVGWALSEPLDETVPSFMEQLTPVAYLEKRHELASKDRSLFVDQADTADLLQRLIVLTLPRANAT